MPIPKDTNLVDIDYQLCNTELPYALIDVHGRLLSCVSVEMNHICQPWKTYTWFCVHDAGMSVIIEVNLKDHLEPRQLLVQLPPVQHRSQPSATVPPE